MFCRSCGEKLDEHDRYCRNCGVRVSEVELKDESEPAVRTRLVLGEVPDEVSTIKLSVISTALERREEDNLAILTVRFELENESEYDFSYVETFFAVLSEDGIPIGELRETNDQKISSGASSLLESSLFLDFTYVDGDRQELTLVLNATASRALVLEAGTAELSFEGYTLSYFGSQEIGDEVRSLGGLVQIRREGGFDEIEGSFLLENSSGSFLPRIDLKLEASGSEEVVIASSASSEQLAPYDIRAISSIMGVNSPLTGVVSVGVTVSVHMMCSAQRCIVMFGSDDAELIDGNVRDSENDEELSSDERFEQDENAEEEETPRIRISPSRPH